LFGRDARLVFSEDQLDTAVRLAPVSAKISVRWRTQCRANYFF
jgi:hypothetical protein